MTDLELNSEISSLPSDLKQEVTDFVAFLKQKNKILTSISKLEDPVVAYNSKFLEEQADNIEKTKNSFSMETIIIHPKNKEQLTALKAVMKALKIDFETEKSPYNPEFVKEILKAREDITNGKGIKIALEDLWK